jgi:hypothetical protein
MTTKLLATTCGVGSLHMNNPNSWHTFHMNQTSKLKKKFTIVSLGNQKPTYQISCNYYEMY